MTANSREAIAAPEIRVRATIRSSDAVLATVPGEISLGSGMADGIANMAARGKLGILNRRVALFLE